MFCCCFLKKCIIATYKVTDTEGAVVKYENVRLYLSFIEDDNHTFTWLHQCASEVWAPVIS